MSAEKINPFDLNQTEYAELLGISPNAVRMRRRRGLLEGQYKFENGKYIFKAPERVRVNQGFDQGYLTTLKKKKRIRRGNHYNANYPNEAFRKHNEMKMLAALKHRVDAEIQGLLPEAIELAKQKRAERSRSTINEQPIKNYGMGLFSESNKGYADPQYHDGRADERHPKKFKATNRGTVKNYKYYY